MRKLTALLSLLSLLISGQGIAGDSQLHTSLLAFGNKYGLNDSELRKLSKHYPTIDFKTETQLAKHINKYEDIQPKLYSLETQNGNEYPINGAFVDNINKVYKETVESDEIYQYTRIRVCNGNSNIRKGPGCAGYEEDAQKIYQSLREKFKKSVGENVWNNIPKQKQKDIVATLAEDIWSKANYYDESIRRSVFEGKRPNDFSWDTYLKGLDGLSKGKEVKIEGKSETLKSIAKAAKDEHTFGTYYIQPTHGLEALKTIHEVASSKYLRHEKAVSDAIETELPEDFSGLLTNGYSEYDKRKKGELIIQDAKAKYDLLKLKQVEELKEANKLYKADWKIDEINKKYSSLYKALEKQTKEQIKSLKPNAGKELERFTRGPRGSRYLDSLGSVKPEKIYNGISRESQNSYANLSQALDSMNYATSSPESFTNPSDLANRFKKIKDSIKKLPKKDVQKNQQIQDFLINALDANQKEIREEALKAVLEDDLIDPENKQKVLMAFLNSLDETKLRQSLDDVCRGKETPPMLKAFSALSDMGGGINLSEKSQRQSYTKGLGRFLQKYMVFYSREQGKTIESCDNNQDSLTCPGAGNLINSMAKSLGKNFKSYENPYKDSIQQRAQLICKPNYLEDIKKKTATAKKLTDRGYQSLDRFNFVSNGDNIARMAEQMNVGKNFPSECSQKKKDVVKKNMGSACDLITPGKNPLNFDLADRKPLDCSKSLDKDTLASFGFTSDGLQCDTGENSLSRVSELSLDTQSIIRQLDGKKTDAHKSARGKYLQLARKKMIESLLKTIGNFSQYVPGAKINTALSAMEKLKGCGVESDGTPAKSLADPSLEKKLKGMVANGQNSTKAKENAANYLNGLIKSPDAKRKLNDYVSAKGTVVSEKAKELMQNYNYCQNQNKRDGDYMAHQQRKKKEAQELTNYLPYNMRPPRHDPTKSGWENFDQNFNNDMDDIYYTLNIEEWGWITGINLTPAQCQNYTNPGAGQNKKVVALQQQMQTVQQFESGSMRFLADEALFVDAGKEKSGQRWHLGYAGQLTHAINQSNGDPEFLKRMGHNDHGRNGRPLTVPANSFDKANGAQGSTKTMEKHLGGWTSTVNGNFDGLVSGWNSRDAVYPGIDSKFNRAFDSAIEELARYDCQSMSDDILDGEFPSGDELENIVFDGDESSTSFMGPEARRGSKDRKRVEANLLLFNNPNLKSTLQKDHPDLALAQCSMAQKINGAISGFSDEKIKKKWWERAKTTAKIGAVIGASLIHPAAGLATGLAVDGIDMIEMQLDKNKLENKLALDRNAFYGHIDGDVSNITLKDLVKTREKIGSLKAGMEFTALAAVGGLIFDAVDTVKYARKLAVVEAAAKEGRREAAGRVAREVADSSSSVADNVIVNTTDAANAPTRIITRPAQSTVTDGAVDLTRIRSLDTISSATKAKFQPIEMINSPKYANESANGVKYLTDSEREAHRLFVVDGKVYDASGKLACSKRPCDKGIFVMDPDGRIYFKEGAEEGKFHHSSFLGGEKVAAAGEMSIKDGELVF